MSVADVVHQTRFPRSVIEALERDDYTVFSSPTYARSYLSQYSGFLGIDPAKWLDFFEPAAFAAPQDLLSVIESPSHQELRATNSSARRNPGNLLPTMLLILLSLGLMYGVVRGYSYFEERFAEPVSLKQGSPAPSGATTPSTPSSGGSADVIPPVNTVANQPPPEATPPPRATIVDE